MYEDSDEDLVVAIGAGPGALPEFYRRHVGRVMGMGVCRFGDPEDVADFVATVFLEVMRSAGGFDPARGSAVSWLCGLAGSVAGGMFRQRTRSADAHQRLAGRTLLDRDDYARVEERIDAAATVRCAYEAMQKLSPADRRVLELVAIDGLSAGEAAEVLELTAVAVRVRLVRARQRLRGPWPNSRTPRIYPWSRRGKHEQNDGRDRRPVREPAAGRVDRAGCAASPDGQRRRGQGAPARPVWFGLGGRRAGLIGAGVAAFAAGALILGGPALLSTAGQSPRPAPAETPVKTPVEMPVVIDARPVNFVVTKLPDGSVTVTAHDVVDPVAATESLHRAGITGVVLNAQTSSCHATRPRGRGWSRRPRPAQ